MIGSLLYVSVSVSLVVSASLLCLFSKPFRLFFCFLKTLFVTSYFLIFLIFLIMFPLSFLLLLVACRHPQLGLCIEELTQAMQLCYARLRRDDVTLTRLLGLSSSSTVPASSIHLYSIISLHSYAKRFTAVPPPPFYASIR